MQAITAGFTRNPRTNGFIEGPFLSTNFVLDVQAVGPGDLFYRQLKFADFDVSELSMSSYAIGLAHGDRTWTALPVFTSREFYHTGILVREDSDIDDPRALRGKRVGVLEYQQTSVVWIRGILAEHYGIDPRELTWFMERRPEQSHGGSTGFVAPEGVRLTYVPAETSLASMLMAGELDAILFYPQMLDAIDRKPEGQREAMRARSLFRDPRAEGERYFAATGIVPINHGVVVRRSLCEAHPHLADELYSALVTSRDLGGEREGFPYGVEANERAIETLLRYLYDQQLIARRVGLEELFFASRRNWAR